MDLVARGKAIIARRSEAVFVPFRQVGMKGGTGESDWSPRPKFCHDNVAVWVDRCPQHKHVYGYVIFDHRLLTRTWQVHPHSVVELEDGMLIDITPSGVSHPYPFIRHVGTEEEFAEMAVAMWVDVPADDA